MKPARTKKRRHPALLAMALIATAGGIWYFTTLPDPSELAANTPRLTAFMRLRQEQAHAAHHPLHLQNTLVPLHAISPLAREAVRLSEDASFYEHDGFDFDEIEAATKEALTKGRTRGASTISQQLVKNVYLSPSRNPLRKVTEAYLTYRLEQVLDKDRILELYLNLVEWGDGIFGIEAASRHYFSKSAFELTPAEAVLLASMLPMPLKQDPRSPSMWLRRRSLRLLGELSQAGRISEPEYRDAHQTLSSP